VDIINTHKRTAPVIPALQLAGGQLCVLAVAVAAPLLKSGQAPPRIVSATLHPN
jgi:hypothetical protein